MIAPAIAGPSAVPAIALSGLTKRYGGRTVVDGLDLVVEPGSIVAILGPNGAGKTTTIETIEGYRSPDAGMVRVLGLDPARDGRRLRSRMGLMLQDGGVQPLATPAELLRLYAGFYARPRDPVALLAAVGLEAVARTRWRRLSGGERQRLSLALALVGRPELLVLDEPTAGMDPAARARTRDLIAEARAAGATVLVTTHELADVERLADRIVVLAAGRRLADGTPAELRAGARPRLELRLERPLDESGRGDLEQVIGPAVRLEAGEAGRYRVAGAPPSPATIAAIATWCAAHDLRILELRTAGATLEERYLELVDPSTAGSTGQVAS